MNVTEMVEAMHDTRVPSAPDLVRISRQGRRIAIRRRAVFTAVVATVVALTAAPWMLQTDGGNRGLASPVPTVTRNAMNDSRELAFEASAPVGTPIAGVAQTDMKFYLEPNHVRSVGAMAFWSEAGTGINELAYGARLIDKDGSLRRAGYLHVPVLPRTGGELVRVPGQGRDEPTFVGLVPLPAGAVASGYRIRIHGTDTLVLKGKSTDVVAGHLLVWVSALTGSEPGVDLDRFSVRDAGGQVVARGSFPNR